MINHKINELLNATGLKFEPRFGMLDGPIGNAAFERFAKLVAKECAKICDDNALDQWRRYKGYKNQYTADANPHTEGMSDGMAVCAVEIRDMFGLDEQS